MAATKKRTKTEEPVSVIAAAAAPAAPADPGRFEPAMNIDRITESETNPRRTFTDMDSLADSIRQHGVIQPILVRPIRPDRCGCGEPISVCDRHLHNRTHELVYGARRLRAAVLAGLTTIPATVRDLSDRDVLEIQVVENNQRADVHPLEEADGFGRLIDAGYDVPSLAAKIGRSETYVRQRLALRDLAEPWREAFFADKFPFSHATAIARLTAADQAGLAKSWQGRGILDGTNSSIGTLRCAIANFLLELSSAAFALDDTDLHITTPCTECPKRTGFAPGLWKDMADEGDDEGDRCTDGACFRKKTQAFLDRQAAKLAKQGDYVQVSTAWRPKANDALPADRYTEITAKEAKTLPDARRALIVDGTGIGRVIHVQVKPEEPKRSASDDDWKKQQEARERKSAVQLAVNMEIFLRAAPNLTALSRENLLEIADIVWEDCGESGGDAFYDLHGIAKTTTWSQCPIHTLAEGKSDAEVAKLLAQILFVRHVDRTHDGMPEPLKAAAEREGIDVAEITAAVKKALATKAKAAKAAGGKGKGKGKGRKAAKPAKPARPVLPEGQQYAEDLGLEAVDLADAVDRGDIKAGRVRKRLFVGELIYCCTGHVRRTQGKSVRDIYNLHPLVRLQDWKGKTRDYEPKGNWTGIIVEASGMQYVMGGSDERITVVGGGEA